MLKTIIQAGLALALLAAPAGAYQPPMLIEAFHDGASGLRTPGWLDAHHSDPAHDAALLEADLARTADDEADEGTDDAIDESEAEAEAAQSTRVVKLRPDQIRRDTPISLGTASAGWLLNGQRLGSNEQILTREGRNFGTPEMVSAIERAVTEVNKRFPGTPRLTVGDLSRNGGGPFRPHRSHQSGRDVDMAYYAQGVRDVSPMQKHSRATLDAARTFTLLRSWLERDEVEYVFIDYRLQQPLYEYARDKARVPAEKLDKWFQYPKGRSARGVIRHLGGHADHLHARFYAPESIAAARAYIQKFGAAVLKPLPVHYTIKKRDNLQKVARAQKVALKDLLKWNRLHPKKRTILKPGQRLVVGWARPRLPSPGR